MKTWFSGLRWLFLALILILGTRAQAVPVQAVPVGGITDTQGVPVGVQYIPIRGDNPWKLHQRYCAETTTRAAVQSAILGPNGLTDARRMPAGKQIDIRCGELKVAYKESALFASPLRDELRTITNQIQGLERKIAEREAEMLALHQTVVQVPGQVERAFAFPSSPFWRDIRFWSLLFLSILLVVVVALLVTTFRNNRKQVSYLRTHGSNANTSEFWVEPLLDKGFSIYTIVFEEGEKRWRLFRFETRPGAANLYTDLLGKQWPAVDDVGREIVRMLNHYVSRTSPVSERRDVERALQEGTLVEMAYPLRRL